MKIGVLALQGNFAEHLAALARIGVQGAEVRLPGQLEGLDGLVIPGGTLAQDTSGNTYACAGDVTIDSTGSITAAP